jgi:hypothetical protein
MFKGFIVALFFWMSLAAGVHFGMPKYFEVPFGSYLELNYLFIASVPMVAIGSILGGIAKVTYTDRFKKLLLICLFLVYLSCLFFSSYEVMISKSIYQTGSDRLIAILVIGSNNFLLYGFMFLPIILLEVFIVDMFCPPIY